MIDVREGFFIIQNVQDSVGHSLADFKLILLIEKG